MARLKSQLLIALLLVVAPIGCARDGFDARGRDGALAGDQRSLADIVPIPKDLRAADLPRADLAPPPLDGPDFAILTLSGPDTATTDSNESYGVHVINLGTVRAQGLLTGRVVGPAGNGGSTSSHPLLGPGDSYGLSLFVVDTSTETGQWFIRACAEVEGDLDPTNDCQERVITVTAP